MEQEIIRDIIIAIVSALATLSAAYLVYRNQKKTAQASADESIATGAAQISQSAIEQVEYVRKINAELRSQKLELEKAFAEAGKNYANALSSIERMESEYRLAMDSLIEQHQRVVGELERLRMKYNEALETIKRLKVTILDYERKVGD